jgi:hypothetical protein
MFSKVSKLKTLMFNCWEIPKWIPQTWTHILEVGTQIKGGTHVQHVQGPGFSRQYCKSKKILKNNAEKWTNKELLVGN